MVDFLACPESFSPTLKDVEKSDAAVPVQVSVCRSPLVDKGALTYFSNFRRRQVRYNSVSFVDDISLIILFTMLWLSGVISRARPD